MLNAVLDERSMCLLGLVKLIVGLELLYSSLISDSIGGFSDCHDSGHSSRSFGTFYWHVWTVKKCRSIFIAPIIPSTLTKNLGN